MATETNTQIEEIVVSGKGINETAAALGALGAAALGTDERVKRATASWEQMKNRFIEGNQAANGAEKALTALQNAVTAGKAKGDELAAVYSGIVSRFGNVAVQAGLTKDSLATLSVKLSDVAVSAEAARLGNERQAAGLNSVRAQYDAVYREITQYGAEITRVKGILEAANVPEAERIRLLGAVNAALNPAVRAENEMTAALQRQREERAKLLAGYREQGALARSSQSGQDYYNSVLNVGSSSAGSAATSASVFQAAFDAEESSKRQAAAIVGLREKYVPLARAQREYLSDLRDIKTASSEVFKTDNERAVAIQRVKDRFVEHVTGVKASKKAVEEHTEATKLQNYQLVNFGQQIQDIGVSLAGGQNPFMVLIQQVPQMSSAVGGVDKIGLAFRSLMTPMVLAATGAATAGGAIFLIGKHAYDAHEQLKALNTSLDRVGRGANGGLFQGAVNTAVEGSSTSRTQGIAAAGNLAGNLNISTDAMRSALGVSRDLAQIMGKDMADAATEFRNALENGDAALVRFNRDHRVLNDDQLEAVRNLRDQGRYTEATTLAIEAMGGRMREMAQNSMGPATRAWNALGDAANTTLDVLSRGLNMRGPTRTEQRGDLEQQLNIAQGMADDPIFGRLNRSRLERARSALEQFDAETARLKAEAEAKRSQTIQEDVRIQEDANSRELERLRRSSGASPSLRGVAEIENRQTTDQTDETKRSGEAQVALERLRVSQRDEVDQLNLQADAQRRLSVAAGEGVAAQMEAERQNRLASSAYQDNTRDLGALSAALSAVDAARLQTARNAWAKQTADDASAAYDLAEAWRQGDVEAIKRASVEKEAIALSKELNLTMGDARAKIELRNSAMTAPEIEKSLTLLRQQVDLQTRLADLEGRGDTAGVRRTTVDSQMQSWRQSNLFAGDDAVAQQKMLLERQQQVSLRQQAYGLQASMDPVVARKKALAELNDLEQQNILSQEDIARRKLEIDLAYEQGEIDKLEATRTFAGGAEAAMRRYALDAGNWATQGASLINKSLKSAEDGFAGFARGTQTAGDAMRSFANVVLMEIERMAAAALMAQSVSPLMNSVFAGIGKLAGSFFGASGDGITPSYGSMLPDVPSAPSEPIMPFPTRADGGLITGPGGPRDDSILAAVSNGEFVVNAAATARNYDLLKAINDNQMPRYANGGPVGVSVGSGGGSQVVGGTEVRIIDQRTMGAGSEAGDGIQTRDGGVGPDGRKIIEVLVTDLVNKALSDGKVDKSMSGNYGVQRKGIAR